MVPSCSWVSMGVSTGAGEAGVTGAASRPWACAEIVKLASFGPDTMGCLLGLGPIRKLGGEREKLLILLVSIYIICLKFGN